MYLGDVPTTAESVAAELRDRADDLARAARRSATGVEVVESHVRVLRAIADRIAYAEASPPIGGLIPPDVKAMILAVLGKCDVAIRCAQCGETFWDKSIAGLFDLTRDDAEAIGREIAPKALTHTCKGMMSS